METIVEQTKKMLVSMSQEYQNKEAQLKKDEREDEALIEKIRANIADIFLTVLNVSYNQVKKTDGSKDEFIEKYMCFFETIPATWIASLEDAKEQDDFETIYKEEAKLSTAEKIKAAFERIAEVSDV